MSKKSAFRPVEETLSGTDRARAFAHELTMLTHKHGIGVTGDPVLFVLEKDDGNLAYSVNKESKLAITSA